MWKQPGFLIWFCVCVAFQKPSLCPHAQKPAFLALLCFTDEETEVGGGVTESLEVAGLNWVFSLSVVPFPSVSSHRHLLSKGGGGRRASE